MKHNMKRFIALTLSFLLWAMPFAAQATDFAAGDMFYTLMDESVAMGKEIHATIKLDVASPAEGDNGIIQMISSAMQDMRLDMTYYDDFGLANVSLTLYMGDTSIATALVKQDADNGLLIDTSLLPGETIRISADSFALLAGGNGEKTEAEEILKEMLIDAAATYFYRLGGWVSETHAWNGDLYLPVDEETAATDERDATIQGMQYLVRNFDFLYLLDNLTFYFRDNDLPLQYAITDVLRERGVTRRQVRNIADTLFTEEKLTGPKHWIVRTEYIKDLDALVIYEDIFYLATCAAYSVRTTIDRVLEGETQFLVTEGEDYTTVGFDGTMDRMWDGFPFENGSFVYNKKTNEGEGVTHSAKGHMELTVKDEALNGMAIDGDLSVFVGNKTAESYNDSITVEMHFTKDDMNKSFQVAAEQSGYIENDEDVWTLNASLIKNSGNPVEVYMNAKSTTAESGEDFTNVTNASATINGLITLDTQIDIVSREYVTPAASETTVVELDALTDEEKQTLFANLKMGFFQATGVLMSLMPSDAIVQPQ